MRYVLRGGVGMWDWEYERVHSKINPQLKGRCRFCGDSVPTYLLRKLRNSTIVTAPICLACVLRSLWHHILVTGSRSE